MLQYNLSFLIILSTENISFEQTSIGFAKNFPTKNFIVKWSTTTEFYLNVSSIIQIYGILIYNIFYSIKFVNSNTYKMHFSILLKYAYIVTFCSKSYNYNII